MKNVKNQVNENTKNASNITSGTLCSHICKLLALANLSLRTSYCYLKLGLLFFFLHHFPPGGFFAKNEASCPMSLLFQFETYFSCWSRRLNTLMIVPNTSWLMLWASWRSNGWALTKNGVWKRVKKNFSHHLIAKTPPG